MNRAQARPWVNAAIASEIVDVARPGGTVEGLLMYVWVRAEKAKVKVAGRHLVLPLAMLQLRRCDMQCESCGMTEATTEVTFTVEGHSPVIYEVCDGCLPIAEQGDVCSIAPLPTKPLHVAV